MIAWRFMSKPGQGSLLGAIACLLLWAPVLIERAAGSSAPRVEPGMEYVHERIGDVPWSIHAVKIRRSDAKYRVVSRLANGSIPGLFPVSGQLDKLPESSGRPVAAVNGDFFHIRPGLYQGDPIGLHIAGAELVSRPIGDSFWIDRRGEPRIGLVMPRFRATVAGDVDFAFGLNEKREDGKAVLYTPAIGESTRTSGGLEFVLRPRSRGEWLPLRAGAHYDAVVAAISDKGNSPVEAEEMVLSVGPEMAKRLPVIQPGAGVTLSLNTSPDLNGVRTAIGGGPVLVRDGKAVGWKSRPVRHPRTAVGWNEEYLFLIVVDGRQEGLSAGMNYPELAGLAIRLGCTEAINLDGGGSSTLWLGGQVVNTPSDGTERWVANSLVVVAIDANNAQQQEGGQDVTSK